MATDLKHMLSLDAAYQLGEQLASAGATVHRGQWQAAMGADFEALGLMDRGRRLAQVMASC